jgi:hypothetical protein
MDKMNGMTTYKVFSNGQIAKGPAITARVIKERIILDSTTGRRWLRAENGNWICEVTHEYYNHELLEAILIKHLGK